jgi:negative regulator of flagellin synthesis FlgM
MKIGNPSDKPVNGATGGARVDNATPTQTTGKTASLDGGVNASAKVTLSTTASSLLSGADPAFDKSKVESVKRSIEEGSYEVNAEVIADKLIANAKELLSPRVS